MSSLFSVLVNELRSTNEEEKIDNKDLAFKVAEEYANTGFKIIEQWLKDGDGIDEHIYEETIAMDLIEQMDEMFTEMQE